MTKLVESTVEEFVIELLEAQGFEYLSPEQQESERADLSEVVLKNRLINAVETLNPAIPADARQQAIRQIINLPSQNLIDNNESLHQMLVDGISVEYLRDGEVKYDVVRLINFDEPRDNEFLVCNQFTVVPLESPFSKGGDVERYAGSKRPDVVLFVNGLPLVVIELKNPADEHATVHKAFTQLQNYKAAIPGLFNYNGLLIASDGLDAKAGTISSDFSRFLAWKSVDGFVEDKSTIPQIETLICGMLNKEVLLDLIKQFIVYEKSKKEDAKTGLTSIVTVKKIAAYHQYFAVNKAVESTLRAASISGSVNHAELSLEDPGKYGLRSTALQPQWHSDEKSKGAVKVVMTSTSSDPQSWQPHNTTKQDRRALAERFKNPDESLKLVIVRDMWLTGFDVPCLHTMYVDKPMRGHNLMQAIARVNRVFMDKPGGLIVDYIGIASDLKNAIATYTESGGQGSPALDQEEAVAVMLEKHEIVCQLMDGFDYKRYFSADTRQKLTIILEAQEFVLGLPDGKNRFTKQVTLLSHAFALAVPHPKALAIKDEVGFFQAVKARLLKFESPGTGRTFDEIETAIKQIVDRAVVSDGVVDVFDAAGIKKPDISILSDEFLAEVQGMEKKNIALELLKKLLNDEIKTRSRKNAVRSKKMSEMLESSIRKYQNNLLTTAQVIEELINLAKEIKKADKRGEELGLTEDEIAFYDALTNNDSAVKVLGDDTLRDLARILVEKVKSNTSIDWTIKENVQAKLRVIVKRTLKQFGYPPDEQLLATENILKQAALLADDWITV